MSGLMAEADAYGKALGASEDLKLLGSILLRTTPPIPAQKQQDMTRYSALMAWTIVKRYDAAFKAMVAALEAGKVRSMPSPQPRQASQSPPSSAHPAGVTADCDDEIRIKLRQELAPF